jgi:hypothetical protein
MMTIRKSFLSALWKIIQGRWRWRLLWLFSDRFVSVTRAILNACGQVLLAHHSYRKDIV